MLGRRWPVLLVSILAGVALGGVYSLSQPDLYEATSTVVLSPESGVFNPSTSENLPTIADTIAELATSDVILLEARADYVTAADNPEEQERRMQADLDWMAERVSAAAVTGTGLVEISGQDSTGGAASDLAESVTKALTDQINSLRNDESSGEGLQVVALGPPTDQGQVSPRTTRDLILGANLGLIVGVLIALLLGDRDRGALRRARLAGSLGVGELTDIPPPEDANGAALDASRWAVDPYDPAEEGLRSLRARLISTRAPRARTVAILGPASPATLRDAAVRLGAQLSSANATTVVVEADFHDSGWTLDGSELKGLGEALEGSPAMANILEISVLKASSSEKDSPTYVDVALLPAGRAPSDIASALASPSFASVLTELHEHYEYVLLIGPNSAWPSEAETLALRVDGTVVVLNHEISIDQAQELRRSAEADPSRLLAVAVPQASDRNGRSRWLGFR